jgi:hypothetical protein
MKRGLRAALLLAVLVGVGIFLWQFLFPNPERVIRQRLAELARTASFSSHEGELAKVDNAQRLTTFFTPDLHVIIDVPGGSRHTFGGRDELFNNAIAARSGLTSLSVEFPDINVKLGPDKQTALVELTARIRISSEHDEFIQELRLALKKVGRTWLIYTVETVKTLS